VTIVLNVLDQASEGIARARMQVTAFERSIARSMRNARNSSRLPINFLVGIRDLATAGLRRLRSSLMAIARAPLSIPVGIFNRASSLISGLGRTITGVANTLITLPALMASSAAAFVGIIRPLNVYAMTEKAQIAFKTLTGSAQMAVKTMEYLKDFTIVSPQRFQDVRDMTQMILAYGLALKDIPGILNGIGNAQAALSLDPQRTAAVVDAIGKMYTKGRVQARETLRLQSQGIPVLKILANEWGITTKQVQEYMRKGQVPANRAIKAILTWLNTGPWKGMMEAQAKTLGGLWSSIQDIWDLSVMMAWGRGVASIIQPYMLKIVKWFRENKKEVKLFEQGLTSLGASMAKIVVDPLVGVVGRVKDMVTSDEFAKSVSLWDKFSLIMQAIFGSAATGMAPLAVMGRAFKTLATGVGGALGSLSQGDMTGAADQIFIMFSSLVDQAIAAINAWLPGILQAFQALVTDTAQWVIAHADEIGNAVVSWVQQIFYAFEQAAPIVIPAIVKVVRTVMSVILRAAPSILHAVGVWVFAFADGFSQVLPEILNSAFQLIRMLVNWIFDMAPTLGRYLELWFREFVNWLIPVLPEVLKWLFRAFAGIYSWLIKEIPVIARALYQIAKVFWEWIEKYVLPWLRKEMPKIWNTIKAEIRTWFPLVYAITQDWGRKIADAIINFLEGFEALKPVHALLESLRSPLGRFTGWVLLAAGALLLFGPVLGLVGRLLGPLGLLLGAVRTVLGFVLNTALFAAQVFLVLTRALVGVSIWAIRAAWGMRALWVSVFGPWALLAAAIAIAILALAAFDEAWKRNLFNIQNDGGKIAESVLGVLGSILGGVLLWIVQTIGNAIAGLGILLPALLNSLADLLVGAITGTMTDKTNGAGSQWMISFVKAILVVFGNLGSLILNTIISFFVLIIRVIAAVVYEALIKAVNLQSAGFQIMASLFNGMEYGINEMVPALITMLAETLGRGIDSLTSKAGVSLGIEDWMKSQAQQVKASPETIKARGQARIDAMKALFGDPNQVGSGQIDQQITKVWKSVFEDKTPGSGSFAEVPGAMQRVFPANTEVLLDPQGNPIPAGQQTSAGGIPITPHVSDAEAYAQMMNGMKDQTNAMDQYRKYLDLLTGTLTGETTPAVGQTGSAFKDDLTPEIEKMRKLMGDGTNPELEDATKVLKTGMTPAVKDTDQKLTGLIPTVKGLDDAMGQLEKQMFSFMNQLTQPTGPGVFDSTTHLAQAQSSSNADLVASMQAAGFDPGMIASICGPIAAEGFAKAFGVVEKGGVGQVTRIAVKTGDYANGQMQGPSSERDLLKHMGVNTEPIKQSDALTRLQGGEPVIIDTPYHYFLAQGYDPVNKKLWVGPTGVAVGGSDWMTIGEIESKGQGGIREFIAATKSQQSKLAMPGGGGGAGAGVDPGTGGNYGYNPAWQNPMTGPGGHGKSNPRAGSDVIHKYIRQRAAAMGFDPNVVDVAVSSEGGFKPNYRSQFVDKDTGIQEASWGPFQLNYLKGSVGSTFTAQTGLHASDPTTWQEQVNFALRYIAAHGWDEWNGPKAKGITGMKGTPGHRGFAEGGWLNEPVVGYGLRSGDSYSLGERGPEYVTPGADYRNTDWVTSHVNPPSLDYGAMARDAADFAGVDPYVFAHQMFRESWHFDPGVIWGKDAWRKESPTLGIGGMAQITDATAEGLGIGLADRFNPFLALPVAAKYDHDLFEQYGENVGAMLAAYNGGGIPAGIVLRGGGPQDLIDAGFGVTNDYLADLWPGHGFKDGGTLWNEVRGTDRYGNAYSFAEGGQPERFGAYAGGDGGSKTVVISDGAFPMTFNGAVTPEQAREFARMVKGAIYEEMADDLDLMHPNFRSDTRK